MLYFLLVSVIFSMKPTEVPKAEFYPKTPLWTMLHHSYGAGPRPYLRGDDGKMLLVNFAVDSQATPV